ncbi:MULTISPECIES: type I-E CRISPR-associated endonuclease Cas1e [Corynebacterium]|uniref:type I-E CRISPR-associated endonuclease Cas1e n=1 Tax=Corynebacterium TaxID=1716 RepID=UPI00078545E5|nr:MULTISPECIES: type I-E CRISPR-associated endonuclease Cas1e [Corynebacterium]OFR38689.1 subtype I-E CRISPR-associated endonuclease Cas1 [Corynebacterium sp. HMSC077D03]
MEPQKVPVDRQELTRVSERISFLYAERAVVNRDNNALTISDQNGTVHVPATTLAALLLGPGTKVTYAAMALLGDTGVSVVWVGEKGVRYYAHGRPPAKTSRFAEAQARIVTNQRARLDCAREMYSMRFPDEDVSGLTMAQLRGREGARVKAIYRKYADLYGVYWDRRRYDPNDFAGGDLVNQALTAANAALYGVSQAVITALGFVPALGVVHNGTDRAFVYDIADLYKAEVSIPAAFAAASEPKNDISGQVRRLVRDAIIEKRLLPRIVKDLYRLMGMDNGTESIDVELLLWNELENIAAGTNWSDFDRSSP